MSTIYYGKKNKPESISEACNKKIVRFTFPGPQSWSLRIGTLCFCHISN